MSIMIIGDTLTDADSEKGQPFSGPSGRLLKGLLSQSGIEFRDCIATNVFNIVTNDVKNLCGPKAEGIFGYPSLILGKYVKAEYEVELTRLYSEIKNARPNLILALGGTAIWALTLQSGIKKVRGTTTSTHSFIRRHVGGDIKILPTYHPSAVNRDWSLRPIVLSDLGKARREQTFAEVIRPQRHIWIEPTIEDLFAFEKEFITPDCVLSIDIETKGDQINCFGVAPSKDIAIVVPLFSKEKDGPVKNYWATPELEAQALRWIRKICLLPNKKLGQNFLYDVRFLWEKYGIPVFNIEEDTMLCHHALQPEMQKGLGFLGSIYTNEASWKFMRQKNETIKKED